jgi:hypothetical protein
MRTTQNTVIKYVGDEQEARELSRATIRNASQKLARRFAPEPSQKRSWPLCLVNTKMPLPTKKSDVPQPPPNSTAKSVTAKNPRLEAVMTMLGAVGEENLYMVGGIGAGFAAPRAGMPRAGAARPGGAGLMVDFVLAHVMGLRTTGTSQRGATAAGPAQPPTP